MSDDVRNAASLVPQVFYDLIGRVVPGAVVMVTSVVLLAPDRGVWIAEQLKQGTELPSVTVLFLLFLLAAYLVGTLLGAVGFVWFEDGDSASSWLSRAMSIAGLSRTRAQEKTQHPFRLTRQRPDTPGGALTDEQISYVYDYILLRDAGAGGRLAKLRAERHMCHVLIVGAMSLLVIHMVVWLWLYVPLYAPRRRDLAWTIPALLVVTRTAFLFDAHLMLRTQRLVNNCWSILSAGR